ncbi:TAT-variant-translocated molybdopterin oxidoreductase [Novosphingobium sp. M1R2S20]|uniref:TAT-variant-translocated molybdopterin oxidoreductase n=1 Tax=Novosphingobium rhizovicinum TaxID=3228928 RepID=A0ABV3RHD6_9SPHN
MSEGALNDALVAVRSAKGRRYWRSLDELVDRADFRHRLKEEFPALARAASGLNRRDLLKCLGGTIALAGLDGCERAPDEEALPYVVQPEGEVPGEARHYASALELDGVAQPIVGETRAARPIKLEGNAAHPSCSGGSTPFMQAALLELYDPDRSGAPLYMGRPTEWARVDRELAQLRMRLDTTGGEGFRLLTGPVGSPTLLGQIEALVGRWPQARWHSWSPVTDRRAEAIESWLGMPAKRVIHLADAEAVVALDDDLLGAGPEQLWHANGWGERRRAYQAGEGAALLLVAEPSPTITGVTAGDRLPVAEARIGALLSGVAARLEITRSFPLNAEEEAWADRAAEKLRNHAGRSLVSVGAHHAPELHKLAFAINEKLGNLGKTERFLQPADALRPEPLQALVEEMRAGEVATLFVLGGNPVYATAGCTGFAEAFARVPLRFHAGLHADETGSRSHWHLPLAHHLECWSDGRGMEGTVAVTQPLVRPWLAVRSRHRLLADLMEDRRSDRELVRATWSDQHDDTAWEQALLVGHIPKTAPAPVASTPTTSTSFALSASEPERGLRLAVRPDPSVWDGSFASNPWLQELPKPLTKLTWGNAVHVSPALAAERGLANGDLVRVRAGIRSITGPIWVLPGQEADTVLVHLGYGRELGRVSQGVGFNAYPLLGEKGEVFLDVLGGREELATTQHHFEMEEDEYVRFVETAAKALPPEPPKANFYPPLKSEPAWGMAIDLDLCIGCNACITGCVAENNIPMVGKEEVAKGREMHWLRVDRYYEGSPENPTHAFQPVPCMHCEDAPCEMGCPVNAAVHSPDGLNLQVYNRCIGTRTCSSYCPYKVRRFNWFDYTGEDAPEMKAVRNPEVTVRSRGVMEKCTYCIQRISKARIEAKKENRPIRDGEVQTACQSACPTQAIVFGDQSDLDTAVSRRKASGRDYDLLPEANTRPRTTYQARIRKGETSE